MCSTLCLIVSAILLLVGLLVFAGILLWCETFQIPKKGRAQLPATADTDQEKSGEGDAEAKAKAEEAAAKARAEADAKAKADAEAKAKADEAAAKARAEADSEAKAKAEEETAATAAAAVLSAKDTEAQDAADTGDSDDSDEARTDADGDGLPDIKTATAEQAADAFREDLDSGVVRQEEQLGILYNQSPDDIDDLKLIKGVAKVLEGRLHESDVFRFKQIALWTDTAAREFGAKLSFRDRIFRDDWIAQAKKFHQEKHREKL